MDAHERELERAAIGGDRDAQTQLREFWRRTGRDLLPVHVRPMIPLSAIRALSETIRLARLHGLSSQAVTSALLGWIRGL